MSIIFFKTDNLTTGEFGKLADDDMRLPLAQQDQAAMQDPLQYNIKIENAVTLLFQNPYFANHKTYKKSMCLYIGFCNRGNRCSYIHTRVFAKAKEVFAERQLLFRYISKQSSFPQPTIRLPAQKRSFEVISSFPLPRAGDENVESMEKSDIRTYVKYKKGKGPTLADFQRAGSFIPTIS